MKIPSSLRQLHADLQSDYEELKVEVDQRMLHIKNERWHYESRVKDLESFALKIETGRVHSDCRLEDFFACTIVVENQDRLRAAEDLVRKHFDVLERRPDGETKTASHSFRFEDLRLYARLSEQASRPRPAMHLRFEIQLKTFLQHAWAIATHDLVYKGGEPSWGKSRIAYQVKAMLEHAETSISAARFPEVIQLVDRAERRTSKLREVIEGLALRWAPEDLPVDQLRLAENVLNLSTSLGISVAELFDDLDAEKEAGRGARLRSLSPFGVCVQTLVYRRRDELLAYLRGTPKRKDFKMLVTKELQLPDDWSTESGRMVVV